MRIGRKQEHRRNEWRCPNCGGTEKEATALLSKGQWRDIKTVELHDNYCRHCGIKLDWEKETYEDSFYDKHREKFGTIM